MIHLMKLLDSVVFNFRGQERMQQCFEQHVSANVSQAAMAKAVYGKLLQRVVCHVLVPTIVR